MNDFQEDNEKVRKEAAAYIAELKQELKGCDAALKESRANDMESMRQLKQFEWKQIETAPKDGTDILGYIVNDGEPIGFADVISWYADKWFNNYGDFLYAKPKFWMPLPPPPKP